MPMVLEYKDREVMNILINIVLVIVFMLSSQFLIAHQSLQEGNEGYQQNEDEFTSATILHALHQGFDGQYTSATNLLDARTERLNDLNTLDSLEFQAKYGYTSGVLDEYQDYRYIAKVLPKLSGRQQQEAERALNSILVVFGLTFLVAVFL